MINHSVSETDRDMCICFFFTNSCKIKFYKRVENLIILDVMIFILTPLKDVDGHHMTSTLNHHPDLV